MLWLLAGGLGAVVLGVGAAVVWWSGATLKGDAVALARIKLQPLGGSLVSAKAFSPGGAPIRLSDQNGRLLPKTLLSPGEEVTVVVVVSRPGWLRWALGQTRSVRLSLRAPTGRIAQQWPTVASGAALRLRFDEPVDRISYHRGASQKTVSVGGRRTVSLGPQTRSGTLELAIAARSWERLGPPTRVTWFPASDQPVVLVDPPVDHAMSPRAPIRLTFSQPVKKVLGAGRPRFTSPVAGRWTSADSHTLLFTPTGFGYPLAATVHLQLPKSVSISSAASLQSAAQSIEWTIAGASFLRLQQLLAEEGYLPLSWQPVAEAPVAQQPLAEINAAVSPPAGRFRWRYPNTPPELQRLWSTGQPNQITRGAVMMFEHDHGLAADGVAGAQVWHALLADAISGKQKTGGYSYVYVHRNVPQLLTLWHNGQTVLTSPGNTGIPAAPTQLGTFPVFEHIPVGTMSGTNPDGSHYNDPGIRWISYFNGGDALHSFTRATFGTPQSLGCVELPLATAARVWPYTPIGTLVTIEN
ncbi:MAG TPA: L,D-transpeptidase family protein [Gaiellaceae bacterium]|nr:L,D-transpeptidase family protein [Gaiellaceae bacterium]